MIPLIDASAVVVLVHGTWAQDAPWTREGSAFCVQLQEQLGIRLRFCRFPWSGVNSHTHRLAAAAQLRELFKRSLSDYPCSSHFVVAHSHGGNVACYALQDDGLRDDVNGVVCLGTPFLHVQNVRLSRSLLSDAALTLAIFGIMAIAYFFWAPEDPTTRYFVSAVMALPIPVIGLLVWGLLRHRGSRLGWRDFLRATRNPTSLANDLAFPSLGPDRLLAVRISGDEAAGALIASQFFAWLFRKAWWWLTPIRNWSERVWRRLRLYLAFILAAAAVARSFADVPQKWLSLASTVIVVFSGLFGLATIAFGLSAYALLVLMLLAHAPVGLDAMLSGFDLQTSAEPTPPHEATVFHVAPSDERAGAVNTLHHSAIYDSPEVIRFVATWIHGRIKTRHCNVP